LGSRFADVYDAFAPLGLLHESYADYLFRGSGVTIPGGLAGACDRLSEAIGALGPLLPSEAGTQSASRIAWTQLAIDVEAFCSLYCPTLGAIEASPEVDLELLEGAADARLFARIYDLNAALDGIFEETFDATADEESRWCFAVSFTVRSMIDRDRIARIDQDLIAVFYGATEATSAPFPVRSGVSEAMAGLVSLCGRDLDPSESEQARQWAAEIHEAFVLGDSCGGADDS
jgi:hypothetical protein